MLAPPEDESLDNNMLELLELLPRPAPHELPGGVLRRREMVEPPAECRFAPLSKRYEGAARASR